MQQRLVRFIQASGVKALGFALFLSLALTGCATKTEPKIGPVFYPPPPNAPRVQFLKSIKNSKDVEEQKKSFSLFVVGSDTSTDQIKEIRKPYGIAYAKGKIYLCDMQTPDIVIMDLVGKKFETLKGNIGQGKLKKPLNVAVDAAGNIFVVDTIRKEVLKYDAAGNFVRGFGKEFVNKPADLAVDATSLYILDLGDSDIKVVDLQSGKLLGSIGRTEGGIQGLSIPTNLASDGKGFLYTTNIGTGAIVKLDKDGHILGGFGKMGKGFGEFVRPKGIATGLENRIFVVDGGHQNVQIFNEEYRLLMFFGDQPNPAGMLNLPASIAVTTDNLEYFQQFAAPGFKLDEVILVTNQMGPDKVSIYGLGQMQEGAGSAPGSEEKTKGK